MLIKRVLPTLILGLVLVGCESDSDDDTDDQSTDPTTEEIVDEVVEETDNEIDSETDNETDSETDSEASNETSNESSADSLRVAIVNNIHMTTLQEMAQTYTDQTGVALNFVALDEQTLINQVDFSGEGDELPYDVINIGMHEVPIWSENGLIQPLSFSEAYDVDDIFPTVRTGLSYEGALYAAPFYAESSILNYRKDLADAAAVQIFDNDTWDNVELAASAMHNPDEGIYGACFRGKAGWGDNLVVITTIANSFGARWFDSGYRPQLDSTEWNNAITFYVDLLNNYGPPNSDENSFNQILALYNDGKCGMWLDSTIASAFIEVEGSTVAQAPNAGFTEGAGWMWAWSYAIPAGTEKTVEANRFIEWATSKEYIQAVAENPELGWERVSTGTRASTYAISEFQEAFSAAAAEKVAIEAADPSPTELKPYLGIQLVAIPEFPEIGTAVSQEMAAAIRGDKTVEEALAASQAAADAIMRDAGYYQ